MQDSTTGNTRFGGTRKVGDFPGDAWCLIRWPGSRTLRCRWVQGRPEHRCVRANLIRRVEVAGTRRHAAASLMQLDHAPPLLVLGRRQPRTSKVRTWL